MARAMELTGSPTYRHTEVVAVPRSPLYQAYQVLHWGLCAVPVLAGLDKFANVMTRWTDYLAPQIASFVTSSTPITPTQLMQGIGVVEILAGLLVALRPRIGGYVVGFWLAAIIANLLIGMHYFDVALRDFGLMVAAFALGRLGRHFDRAHKAEDVIEHEDRGLMVEPVAREARDGRDGREAEGGRLWRHRGDDMV